MSKTGGGYAKNKTLAKRLKECFILHVTTACLQHVFSVMKHLQECFATFLQMFFTCNHSFTIESRRYYLTNSLRSSFDRREWRNSTFLSTRKAEYPTLCLITVDWWIDEVAAMLRVCCCNTDNTWYNINSHLCNYCTNNGRKNCKMSDLPVRSRKRHAVLLNNVD